MVQEREETRALPKPRVVQKHKNTGVSRKLWVVQEHEKTRVLWKLWVVPKHEYTCIWPKTQLLERGPFRRAGSPPENTTSELGRD